MSKSIQFQLILTFGNDLNGQDRFFVEENVAAMMNDAIVQSVKNHYQRYADLALSPVTGVFVNSLGMRSPFDSVITDPRELFDVQFDDDEHSNSKGFAVPAENALAYVKRFNGTHESYFADYVGGTVSVRNIKTGEVIFSEKVKNYI